MMMAKRKNKVEELSQGVEQKDKGWKIRRKETYTTSRGPSSRGYSRKTDQRKCR